MLVLSRKPGERILVGEDIVVTVVRVSSGVVRLGIEAPREYAVIRDELTQKAAPPKFHRTQEVSQQADCQSMDGN